ncbi:hypothetical protein ACGFIX_19375 [Nocardia salmonicida]|uniref:hypothetical protein n=1 Tax=Nocardia salmonicida TaxID=53431 RepID=UPI00372250A3
MTELDDKDSRVLAAMRLSGSRFDSEGMPADSLVEIAAFEDLLRSLVRLYWFDRNPHRRRLPKGYNDEITLRLTGIAEGSSIPVLEHDSVLEADNIFGPYEIKQDYARAIGEVGKFITHASTNQGEIPSDIRRLPANKVKRFGQTMQPGDAIQVASTDTVEWEKVTRYTPTARSHALVSLVGAFTQLVTIEGQVIDFNVAAGRMVVRDRIHRGEITIPYLDSGVVASIAADPQLFEYQAEGIGEFNADGRLLRLASVRSLTVNDVTEDARNVRGSLEALADLDEGWVDGESGQPIAPSVIRRGQVLIDAMLALKNITRTVAPTEEGGVSFYWPEAENQLSIEIEPSGALYIHTTNLRAGTFSEGKVPPDAEDLIAILDSWLTEAADD